MLAADHVLLARRDLRDHALHVMHKRSRRALPCSPAGPCIYLMQIPTRLTERGPDAGFAGDLDLTPASITAQRAITTDHAPIGTALLQIFHDWARRLSDGGRQRHNPGCRRAGSTMAG